MRWNDLFGDLEGQLAAAHAAEFEAGVRDLAVAERATVGLAERIFASRGRPLALTLRGGERVRGEVADAAAGWVLLEEGSREHVVPLGAVAFAAGVSRRPRALGSVGGRLGLGHVLRAIAAERTRVIVSTGGGEIRGRIRDVGADHADVTPDEGRETLSVPFGEILRVSSSS